jgi:hypothetical protein
MSTLSGTSPHEKYSATKWAAKLRLLPAGSEPRSAEGIRETGRGIFFPQSRFANIDDSKLYQFDDLVSAEVGESLMTSPAISRLGNCAPPSKPVMDVTDTLTMALEASDLDSMRVAHRPKLLSDNGSSYIAGDLADWLKDQGMDHVRGAPLHPQTKGKIVVFHAELSRVFHQEVSHL